MIRSSKCSILNLNTGKREVLEDFLTEYRVVVQTFVDKLWNEEKIGKFINTKDFEIETILSARAIQSAAKQASGIVRGTRVKHKKREFTIEKLRQEGKFKKARKLQEIHNKQKLSCPIISNLTPAELDSRFVKINFSPKTKKFDIWIKISSLFKPIKDEKPIYVNIPIKKHKHFNKISELGKITSGVRISEKNVTFAFKIDKSKKEQGSTIGIDIGQNAALSVSTGVQIIKDKDGHSYKSICEELSRKEKGSKAFRRKVTHRTNFINYSVNQLNLEGVKTARIENIKNLRKGKTSGRRLSHWNYAELVAKLELKFLDAGVQIEKVCPTYTSQRCSVCGWTRRKNRNGELFICTSCGHTCNADLNGSINISLGLPEISREERQKQLNRKGFYWLPEGQEHIVPDVQETVIEKFQ